MRDVHITGGDVVLEPLCGEHASELAPLLDDPRVAEMLGVADVEGLRRRFARWETRRSPDGGETWLNWLVRRRADGRALGWTQATVRGATVSVAYALVPAARGHGAAAAAVRAMTAWLRSEIDAREITASIAGDNIASARVARAAGFMPTDRRAGGEVVWVQRAPLR